MSNDTYVHPDPQDTAIGSTTAAIVASVVAGCALTTTIATAAITAPQADSFPVQSRLCASSTPLATP
jgi:hypothetical protein